MTLVVLLPTIQLRCLFLLHIFTYMLCSCPGELLCKITILSVPQKTSFGDLVRDHTPADKEEITENICHLSLTIFLSHMCSDVVVGVKKTLMSALDRRMENSQIIQFTLQDSQRMGLASSFGSSFGLTSSFGSSFGLTSSSRASFSRDTNWSMKISVLQPLKRMK